MSLSHNKTIRTIMYQLKKQYGKGPVDIYQITSSDVDLRTGVRAVTQALTRVNKAVVIPARHEARVDRSISLISADKKFVFGGAFDRSRQTFLIDHRDIPNLDLSVHDFIVYNDKKYEISHFDQFEEIAALAVVAHHVEGNNFARITPAFVSDILDISDELSST